MGERAAVAAAAAQGEVLATGVSTAVGVVAEAAAMPAVVATAAEAMAVGAEEGTEVPAEEDIEVAESAE